MQRDLRTLGTELLAASVEAATVAAVYVRSREPDRDSIDWELKSRADFVSAVDREAESRIAEVLLRRVPGAAIVGEELSPDASAPRGIAFVVDPLDGTTNFLHGYPQYAVSIGAMVDGELAAGVVADVTRGHLYTASSGQGAYRDGAPIRVSRVVAPERALVGTGFPFKQAEHLERFVLQFGRMVRGAAGVRRAGAASLDLADVASGRLDAFWELMLAPWDIAAGMMLVREAGGAVTDLSGQRARVEHTALLATNDVLHPWMLDQLGPA